MALDPEELKKRRLERKLRQEKRKAEQRRLILRLSIAAVVLLICALLIVFTRPDRGEDPVTPTQATAQTPEATQNTEKQPEKEADKSQVRLVFAGDLNVTDALVKSGGNNLDYTQTFLDVAPVLSQADVTVVNFEGNLLGSPYGSASASAPQQLLGALRRAGVDMLQLANSYSIHGGVSGLHSTISGAYTAGLEPLGVYMNTAAYRDGKGFALREINGIKIAFVAFTKGMDGMALPAGNEHCVNLLYTDYDSTYQTIDREGITQILQNVQKAKPDFTVALLHWGSEYNNTISESQEEIVALMQANGVDAIVGTHSHYVQKMEQDPETGNFVAYSLGDFCSDAKRAGTEYSVVLELEITRDNKDKATSISKWSYTPIFSVNEKGRPLQVVRLDTAITAYENGYMDKVSQQTYEAMVYAKDRIEARIKGE